MSYESCGGTENFSSRSATRRRSLGTVQTLRRPSGLCQTRLSLSPTVHPPVPWRPGTLRARRGVTTQSSGGCTIGCRFVIVDRVPGSAKGAAILKVGASDPSAFFVARPTSTFRVNVAPEFRAVFLIQIFSLTLTHTHSHSHTQSLSLSLSLSLIPSHFYLPRPLKSL